MTEIDVRKHSVTAGDVADTPYSGIPGVYYFLSSGYYENTYTDLRPYWSYERDFQLLGTVHMESMWASAVMKAITKIASLSWDIEDSDDSSRRTERAQQLFHTVDDGQGWVPFVSRHLRSFLLTDNGAFVEIVRATSDIKSRIIGLMHLDPCRCKRTGDPDIPILYRDRKGREHEMKWYQVLMFSDMPDPSDTYFGVGFCAASRAYNKIRYLAAMEQYSYEKMTGDGATELTFIQGLSAKSLDAAIKSGEEEKIRKGVVYYKGKMIVPVMGDATPLTEITIPLKSVADGFDPKLERDNAYMVYANAIGVPVQDIQPLSGQGLGTGTQAVILDESAAGQGLAAWKKQWTHMMNQYILPETTTFIFQNTNDLRDQKDEAEVKKMRAETRAAQITSGEITPQMALQLAVDNDDVPREFLPQDITPGGQLSDSEKPLSEDAPTQANALLQNMQQQLRLVPQQPEATKATAEEVDALLEDEIDQAIKLYQSVRRAA